MKTFEINKPLDVAKFFVWLTFDKGIVFHPDDGFDYADFTTGENTFDSKEQDYYERLLDKCFIVCENADVDIYEIALRIQKLYLDYSD